MGFTQNQRLLKITENTLIIGADIAKRTLKSPDVKAIQHFKEHQMR